MLKFITAASIFVMLLFSASAFAHDCAASGVYVYAFKSPADQHAMFTKLALEDGAGSVQTAIAAGRTAHRYLVLSVICDAYSSFPVRVERPRSNAIVIPDDHPYLWLQTGDFGYAAAEFAAHENAAARGMASLSNGSFVVFWTRANR